MEGTKMISTEERKEKVDTLHENAAAVFRMLIKGEIAVEQAKYAVELLQLMYELLDLSDSLGRRSAAK
jgi:hypothetical protein